MKMQEIFEGVGPVPASRGFTRGMTPEFEVDGYKYYAEVQDEEDVSKIFHYVVDPKGMEHSLDWSPYIEPTAQDIQLWVQLGMPSRKELNSVGPLRSDDLKQYAQQRERQ